MRRVFIRLAAACLSASLLSGCLAFGDIDRRATSFDEGVGSFQNRAILLNLARASLKEPMYFVSVGSTNAVGATDFRASMPSFAEGPKLTSTLHAYTFSPGGSTFLDNQTSTNTQMNVFSTHDFYLGMMEPLTLDEINLLLHQGYERELVFYLTIAKAKITPLGKDFKPSGPPHYIYNDPDGDPANYAEFAGHIQLAMEAGLTTDVPPEAKSGQDEAGDKVIAAAPAPGGAKSGGGVEFVVKAEKKSGPKVVECVDPALQSTRGREFVGRLKALKAVRLCDEPEDGVRQNVVFWRGADGEPEAQRIEIVFRSTYQVFRYLGALVREPAAAGSVDCQSQVQPLHAAPVICDYAAPDRPSPIGPLLRVEPGGLAAACFTAVSYAGRRYCIPNGGREVDMTKDVFNILVSLLALKQSPGDLPTPQAVILQ